MNKITSVIPTYNNLPFLQLTVKSVRKNCYYKDMPLVIFAENCTDGTDEWLEENADELGIEFYIEKNEVQRGIGGGIDFCVSKVKTEFVNILHSDFWVAPNQDIELLKLYDEVDGRNINITGVGTITRLNTTNLVGTISTLTRIANTDFVGTSATITQLNATDLVVSGLITATSFTGSAQVAISSEGDYMGAGASVLNFSSSTGQAIVVTPAGTSGIATIQVKPGASLGLAIALGG